VSDLRREARVSWWIWLPLLTAGFATWVAFLYAGARATRRSWQLAGLGYLALVVLEVVLLSFGGDTYSTAGGFVIILTWLAASHTRLRFGVSTPELSPILSERCSRPLKRGRGYARRR